MSNHPNRSRANNQQLARALARLLNAFNADRAVLPNMPLSIAFQMNSTAVREAQSALIASGYRSEIDMEFGEMYVEPSVRAVADDVADATRNATEVAKS
jgi:hypothetical protein